MDSYWSGLIFRAFGDSVGFFVDSPVRTAIAILILAGTLIVRYRRKGKDSVKEELKDLGWGILISLGVFTLVFIVYILVVAPKELVHEERARAKNAEIAIRQVPLLRAALLHRMNRAHLIDPAYQNYYGLVGAFQILKRERGGKCIVFVSGNDSDPEGIAEALGGAAFFNGCGQPSGEDAFNGEPESVAIQRSGSIPGKVLIRTTKDSVGILALADSLGPFFNVERSHDLPKELGRNVIWLQVGDGVTWNPGHQLLKIPAALLRPVPSVPGNEDVFSDYLHREADQKK